MRPPSCQSREKAPILFQLAKERGHVTQRDVVDLFSKKVVR
ncbi:hypothetical protein ACFFJT_00895 [Dyella flava]|nr:hypothetical protein [Dyella flava]